MCYTLCFYIFIREHFFLKLMIKWKIDFVKFMYYSINTDDKLSVPKCKIENT